MKSYPSPDEIKDQMVAAKIADVWQTLSGPEWRVRETIKIQPEIFTRSPDGLKIPASPGCIVTVTGEDGSEASIRIDGVAVCEGIASFIAKCGKPPLRASEKVV